MIKAVIFDFWNTLAHGKSKKNSILEIGKMLKLMDRKLWYKPIEEGIMAKEFKSKRQAFANLCNIIGIEPTEKMINKLIKKYGQETFYLFPDTIPMLKKLKEKFRLAVISNTDCFSAKAFHDFGLDKYFDLALFSCHTGILKPDERIFQTVLEKFKLKPEEVVMVGDNFHDDIEPALRMGMDGILIKRKTRYQLSWKEEKKYEKTVNNLKEIMKCLK
jgi:putative hydrolase of the HAD superfamily